jgi:hypothetical protein
MSLAGTAVLETLPGERELVSLLQATLKIRVGEKNVRTGRLVHFKRTHFVYHLTFLNSRGNRETLELPLPFFIEMHRDEKLMYFDYRNDTLSCKDDELLLKIKKIKSNNASIFYNNIVEIDFNN